MAAVRGLPRPRPPLFFPRDHEGAGSRAAREQQAGAVCQPCPIRESRGSFAVSTGERHGFRGGTSELERRRTIRAA